MVVPPVSSTVTAAWIVPLMLPLPTLTVFVPPPRSIDSGVPMAGNVSPSTFAVSLPAPPMIVVLVVVASNVEWMLKVLPAGPPSTRYELTGPNDVKLIPPVAPPGPVMSPRAV